MENQKKLNQSFSPKAQEQKSLKLWLPRTESLVLFVGLAFTIWGKFIVVQSYGPANLFLELAYVVFPDLVFFSIIALVIRCLYILRPTPFIARSVLLVACVVVMWSILNAIWLVKSSVQLQPGILILFANDFPELWPLVQSYLAHGLIEIVFIGITGIVLCAFFLWRFIRPAKVVDVRTYHLRWAVGMIVVIIIIPLLRPGYSVSSTNSSFAGEVLGFSSHWYALVSTVSNGYRHKSSIERSQNICLSGNRQIEIPTTNSADLPNVVLVLLESISYSVTSLADPQSQTTPYLGRLADEGVEFKVTRVPVPYTTKAFWPGFPR
ncbi:hypothetical protein ACFL3G_06890 [Planctomycetota bacterium]